MRGRLVGRVQRSCGRAVDRPGAAGRRRIGAVAVSADTIEHPTGAGDIVLRAATRGGFMRLETVMSRLPEFTLYGDGRALILPPGDEPVGRGRRPQPRRRRRTVP